MQDDITLAPGDAPASPPAAPPTRAQRFWSFPLTRIVLYGLVFLVIAVGLSVGLGLTLRLAQIQPRAHRELVMALGEAVLAAGAVLAFWVMTQAVDRRPWAGAGFTPRAMAPQLLLGLAVGAAAVSVGVGTLHLLGVYQVAGHDPRPWVLLPLLLYLAVGVFEETFFRGYAFQTLEGRWGSGVALAVTSLAFGLSHLGNPVHGVTPLERLAGPAFICLEAGLPLGAAYLLTRRWWLPIGIHWAWDFCEGPVYGLHDSGMADPHTWLRSHVSGPFWATGGPFGPEASLVFLLTGTLLGVLLLGLAVARGQWRPRPARAGRLPA